ncbi:hypothetical protein BJ322DRAFT_1214801 [Thelephora terrestris]|uniref:Uncharacterized protein n=1 Tax=Thelephora terrestris TaxID=56493 RepID=A0A9P6L1J1_9AGAM|nr:hypothetical protein BJ322DRAFT_1214801 [Thelephora terrestris]
MPPSASPGPGDDDNGPRPPGSSQDCGEGEKEIIDAKELRRCGRGIRRLVTLCGTVTQLVAEYDRRLLRSEPNSDDGGDCDNNGNGDEGDEDMPPEKREEVQRRRSRDYRSYLELVKLIPTLKDRITDPHGGARMLYYARLLDCANNARSDDTARVKPIIANLLNNRANNPANPPLDLDTREARGLQNDFTGRLLCPIMYDWEDPAVRAKVRDCSDGHNASNNYWLRCLYEGEKGDPEDVEKGFLKSALLVKTFQMIFTAPSSARGNLDAERVPGPRDRQKKTPSKRPPVAEQLRMDGQVTARSIAYAAVQMHFALCDATHWMNHYNGFNYEEFYEFIIDFFESDETPEGKAASEELYNWWNKQVFPRSAATRAALGPISARHSSLALLRDQRRARVSRAPS